MSSDFSRDQVLGAFVVYDFIFGNGGTVVVWRSGEFSFLREVVKNLMELNGESSGGAPWRVAEFIDL